ncbi:MAG TPA: sarcosine oxidase subunit gamma family protein [Microlunatus sp.]
MTAEALTARGPLDGYPERFSASALTICALAPVRQLSLRIDPDLPAAAGAEGLIGIRLPSAGRSESVGDTRVYWLGPDEWLLIGPADEVALAEVLRPAGGAVVDASGQRTVIEISGPYAREVLAKGCALDLHPRVVSAGFAVPTLLAHVPVIIDVRENGDPTLGSAAEISAAIIVRTTFARHLADWLLDAAVEYAT